jgi:nicotinate phosphoribosyltransferase
MTADGSFAPIMKLSKDKITLPGRKQVYRFKDAEGNFEKDVIALANEKIQGDPLLVKVMEKGKLIYDLPSLEEIRATATENLSKLSDDYKVLIGASVYPVELSRDLLSLIRALRRQLTMTEINHGVSSSHV